MSKGKLFFAGVVGGAAMSVVMGIARAMGMQVNLEMMLGTLPGLQPGPLTWIIGLVMHLMISGLIALVYGVVFERVLHRAGIGAGLLVSIGHTLLAGLFMGMVPMMHPLIPEQMPAPGFFMANIGVMGVAAEVMLHLMYGAIVGGLAGGALTRRVESPAHS
ncbi:MAG: hypothetical protein H0V89_11590 [Deltaproteobacteria bacterium]|nr:hypothetical protein [Deltaproteobacteria bacterium]